MESGNVFKYSVPFTMVANELIMCEYMSPILKTIYSIACCYASSEDSSCYPSYTTIARKAGVSRRKAIYAVKELVAAGLLSKKTKQNAKQEFTSNTYIINQWSAQAEQYFKCPPPAKAKEKEEKPKKDTTTKNDTAQNKSASQSAQGSSAGDAPPPTPEQNTRGSAPDAPPPSAPNAPGSAGDAPPFLMNKNQVINNHGLNNNQSIPPEVVKADNSRRDGAAEQARAERDELRHVLEQCCLERFTPEVAFLFQNAVDRLFYSSAVKVGTANLPKEKIRSYLHLLDSDTLDTVLKIMLQNKKKITNRTAWLMTTIINEICAANSELILSMPAEYQNNADFYATG